MSTESEMWLRRNFTESLMLPSAATEWLVSAWNVAQVFDDMADGDQPDRDKLDAAIMDALVSMPANVFFRRHQDILLPILALAVLKWKASDDVERDGHACATSFVWRAGYYDLVLAAVQLTHGPEAAMNAAHMVLKLYGESFDDYMKEMAHA
jgi:hypothetical protein